MGGVVKRRGGAALALQPLERLSVLGKLFREKLEHHEPAEFGIFGLVDHTSGPAA